MSVETRLAEAIKILGLLGMPREQINDRSAYTLLALLDLEPDQPWSEAKSPLIGITPIMAFAETRYGKKYAPNTRETFRRFTMHQFVGAGIAVLNPDDPKRPVNSPKTVYQIAPDALNLLRVTGTLEWEPALTAFHASLPSLRDRYAAEREMNKIPLVVREGQTIYLTPGGQNNLVDKIWNEFAARFTPGGKAIYIGDTGDKYAYFDKEALAELGVTMDTHGKMPDVIIHYTARGWLILVEAVTSHGPISQKRKDELTSLFAGAKVGLVFVTAFETRRAFTEYHSAIAWETEVWIADNPTHMIHYNGERFLGPYG